MTVFGIGIGGDMRTIADLARTAEELGYESVWVAETSWTPFVQAALACHVTNTITVGTDIALAFPRSPTITAMTARDLAELSNERFILGLGSQVKRVNEFRFSVPFEHPAPKMGEYIEVVRKVLATFGGEPIDHQGRFYTVTMPPFPGAGAVEKLPIYLAAMNEKMAETAGRVADGVLIHPMTSPKYIAEVVRPAVERGATGAGRDPADVSISTSVILQVNDDVEVARRQAAYQIGFYATTRTYKRVLEIHGFGDLVDPLREAHGRKDLDAMADIATPMVDTYSITGPVAECKEQLASFDGVVDRIILGGSWIGPDRSGIVENYLRIMQNFGQPA
ncbi:MAG: LLM class flavin-dependent oxidoreductase [Actinomycetota bacterium]